MPQNPALDALRGARSSSGSPDGGPGDDPGVGMLGLPNPGPGATRNPLGTDKQTKEVFVDRGLLNGMKVKKGDRIEVCGMITTLGNVIGFIPDSVGPDDEDDDQNKEDEENQDYDPDMHDDMGDEPAEGDHGESNSKKFQ